MYSYLEIGKKKNDFSEILEKEEINYQGVSPLTSRKMICTR